MADYLSKHTGIEIDNSVDKTAELETRVTELEQKEVTANNGEATTDTLSTLKVGNTNYAIPSGGGSVKLYKYSFNLKVNSDVSIYSSSSYSMDLYFDIITTYNWYNDTVSRFPNQQVSYDSFVEFLKKVYTLDSDNYIKIYNVTGQMIPYLINSVRNNKSFSDVEPQYILFNDNNIVIYYKYYYYSMEISESNNVIDYTLNIDNVYTAENYKTIFSTETNYILYNVGVSVLK